MKPNVAGSKLRVALCAVAALSAAVPQKGAAADAVPSGQVQLGQTVIEPAYNYLDGSPTFLLTPKNLPTKTDNRPVAPLYIVVYPTEVADVIGTVNCQHQPVDNCPEHGPTIAALAQAAVPGVYKPGGVWGHDHILAAPPSPPSAAAFSVTWLPIAILFADTPAASTHITTIDQLTAALQSGRVLQIPLPAATFQGSSVASAAYGKGTPLPPAPALP